MCFTAGRTRRRASRTTPCRMGSTLKLVTSSPMCPTPWGGSRTCGATMRRDSGRSGGSTRGGVSVMRALSSSPPSRWVPLPFFVSTESHAWSDLWNQQAGPRVCLGREFAYRQMKIFAAVLLHFFAFEMADEGTGVRYRTMLTLQTQGLRLRAFPRQIKRWPIPATSFAVKTKKQGKFSSTYMVEAHAKKTRRQTKIDVRDFRRQNQFNPVWKFLERC